MAKSQTNLLSEQDLEAIHQTSLKILSEIGIIFPDSEALKIFRDRGFKTDGDLVYFSEDQITSAISSVPDQFSIQAWNADRSVHIGDGNPVFAPGYGAPFIIDPDLGKVVPGIKDYEKLVKLAQSLPNQDLSGHLLVEPQDVSAELAHLYMLKANILYSDKPFIGSTEGVAGANHTLDLISILFGDSSDQYCTLGLINPLSPLRYSKEMIEAILVYARGNQPLVFASLIMAGYRTNYPGGSKCSAKRRTAGRDRLVSASKTGIANIIWLNVYKY